MALAHEDGDADEIQLRAGGVWKKIGKVGIEQQLAPSHSGLFKNDVLASQCQRVGRTKSGCPHGSTMAPGFKCRV